MFTEWSPFSDDAASGKVRQILAMALHSTGVEEESQLIGSELAITVVSNISECLRLVS